MKKSNIICLICLLLACMMILPFFASCGAPSQDKGGSETKGEQATKNEQTGETDKVTYTSKVPDGYSFNDQEFRILAWDPNGNSTWYDCDFSATGLTGDVVNDKAFERMKEVEDNLHCVVRACYDSGDHNQAATKLALSVSAGDDDYHAAIVTARSGFNQLAEKNSLLDFTTLSQLDIDAPWWDQNTREGLSMGGKLYTMAGDISILYRKCLRVYYFSKTLHEEMNFESFYDLVESGKWTIEKMTEFASQVSKDMNGDGTMGKEDCYGLIATVDTLTTGFIGCDVSYVTKDASDFPVLDFYNDKTADVFDIYVDLLYDKDSCVMNTAPDRGYDTTTMFKEDRALFSNCELHNLKAFRQMETNFGILPTPKYDEYQAKYQSTVNPVVCGLLVIPTTNVKDLTDTCIILDALGAASKNLLTPAYYDIYLQGQSARDEESAICLDIIFNNIKWDIGNIYNWGNIGIFTHNMTKNYNRAFTSEYEKIAANVNTALNKTVDIFLAQ